MKFNAKFENVMVTMQDVVLLIILSEVSDGKLSVVAGAAAAAYGIWYIISSARGAGAEAEGK